VTCFELTSKFTLAKLVSAGKTSCWVSAGRNLFLLGQFKLPSAETANLEIQNKGFNRFDQTPPHQPEQGNVAQT